MCEGLASVVTIFADPKTRRNVHDWTCCQVWENTAQLPRNKRKSLTETQGTRCEHNYAQHATRMKMSDQGWRGRTPVRIRGRRWMDVSYGQRAPDNPEHTNLARTLVHRGTEVLVALQTTTREYVRRTDLVPCRHFYCRRLPIAQLGRS